MTPDQFRAALKSLGISQKWLAGRLGLDVHTVSRWAMGQVPVAPYVPFVLDLLRERQELGRRLSAEP